MNNIKKIFLGLILFLVTFSVSQACKFTPREYSQTYKISKKVFLGEIVPRKKKSDGIYYFKVLKTLKGEKMENIVEVIDPMFGTSCQKWGYESGKFWIISINGKNEVSEVNLDKSFKTSNEAEEFFLKNFSKKENKIKSGNLEQKKSDVVQLQMVGPTGPPNVKGPTSPPPTRAEIERMKARAEGKSRDGLGFWEKVWDWIINLFK